MERALFTDAIDDCDVFESMMIFTSDIDPSWYAKYIDKMLAWGELPSVQLAQVYTPSEEQLISMSKFDMKEWLPKLNMISADLFCALIKGETEVKEVLKYEDIIEWKCKCLNVGLKSCESADDIFKIAVRCKIMNRGTMRIACREHNVEWIQLNIQFGMIPDSSNIDVAIRRSSPKLKEVIDLLKVYCPLSDEQQLFLANNGVVYSYDMLNRLIEHGKLEQLKNAAMMLPPQTEQIKLACKKGNIKVIKVLLQHRLSVDADDFEAMFLRDNRWWMNKTDKSDDAELFVDQIEIFIEGGYELTYEDVLRLTRRGLYVKDIGRFNFKFDDRLAEICRVRRFWPYSPEFIPFTEEDLYQSIYVSSTIMEKILESGVVPKKDFLDKLVDLPTSFILVAIKYIKPTYKLLVKWVRYHKYDAVAEEIEKALGYKL